MPFMMFFGVLLLVGSVLLLVWGVRRIFSSDIRRQETALDIAKRRYANGEINREEYERLKQDLEQ